MNTTVAAVRRVPGAGRELLLVSVGAMLLAPFIVWAAAEYVRTSALRELGETGNATLGLVKQSLSGELSKYAQVPQLISHYPSLFEFLVNGAPESSAETISRQLEQVNDITGALDTYLLDRSGLTVAASNWQSDKPFIGRSFDFRPYFQEAMDGKMGRYYALGTTSNRRGYYFAFPIFDQTRVLGVIVVKIRIDHFEQQWRSRSYEVVVVDENGVNFLSTNPEWRFRTFHRLSDDERERLLRSAKYSDTEIGYLDVSREVVFEGFGEIVRIGSTESASTPTSSNVASDMEYLVQQDYMPEGNWVVKILTETTGVTRQVVVSVLAACVGYLSLVLLGAYIWERRAHIRERMALEAQARETLEDRVAERTRDLRRANVELRETQDELIQAGKLAALGHMSAGLCHELNQPLTAINSFIENAKRYLHSDQTSEASKKLGQIGSLVDRMALIIKQLRAFARPDETVAKPVPLIRNIREVLERMAEPIARAQAEIDLVLPADQVWVFGEDVAVQCVLTNLIQNALDATQNVPNPIIKVTVTVPDNMAIVTIEDNGEGIAETNLQRIFDPLFTTKKVGSGLGLGLSIVYRILKEFGGSISAQNHAAGGAMFTLKFPASTGAQR